MSIELKVHPVRNTGVFYGGDEVCRTVEVRGPLPFPSYNDSKVHLVFEGSSETAHVSKGGAKFTDKAIFFQVEKVLFDGIVDFQKGDSQTWQFSFKLPERTESDGVPAKLKRKKRCDVFLTTPHPIPQSTALSGSSPYPWQALISYTLHAKVSGKWGWREDKIALLVVPKPRNDTPPADLAVQSKNFTHSSSRLLPEEAQRKRSVNKWLRDKLASNTPKAVFSIKAQTLQTFTPGHRMPIHLQLDYDTEESNLSSLPELRLLDMVYRIFVKTEVWGDDFMSTATNRELAGRWAPKVPTIDLSQYKLDDGVTRQVTLDQALVSPFKTYNVSRSYEAVMSFSFECAGKKYKAEFSWPLHIVFDEHYIPPHRLLTSGGDKEGVEKAGEVILNGLVTLVTTILGV